MTLADCEAGDIVAIVEGAFDRLIMVTALLGSKVGKGKRKNVHLVFARPVDINTWREVFYPLRTLETLEPDVEVIEVVDTLLARLTRAKLHKGAELGATESDSGDVDPLMSGKHVRGGGW